MASSNFSSIVETKNRHFRRADVHAFCSADQMSKPLLFATLWAERQTVVLTLWQYSDQRIDAQVLRVYGSPKASREPFKKQPAQASCSRLAILYLDWYACGTSTQDCVNLLRHHVLVQLSVTGGTYLHLAQAFDGVCWVVWSFITNHLSSQRRRMQPSTCCHRRHLNLYFVFIHRASSTTREPRNGLLRHRVFHTRQGLPDPPSKTQSPNPAPGLTPPLKHPGHKQQGLKKSYNLNPKPWPETLTNRTQPKPQTPQVLNRQAWLETPAAQPRLKL
jgi:hypothetical protein